MLDKVLAHLESDRQNAVARMCQLLSIPSVSTDPAFAAKVREGADWVAARLKEAGMGVTVHPTGRHPIVVAKSERIEGAPHVLFYGHYDVQPPDPLEKWTTRPFEPTIRDGAVYARGASDDKGQVCCFIEALRAWHTVSGRQPVNVTVVIEGEEECGSAHLPAFLKEHREELSKADVVLISDTTMWDRKTVAITYGLRGLLYFDVQLHGPKRDLHSGMYGGVLANPATMLTRGIGKLFDEKNRVVIPGFYDDVKDVTVEEKARWSKLGFDEFEHCLTPVGVDTPFGEAGYATLERKWARPSCDVNGLYGGYGGEGAKTVIPSFAGCKVSFRLAADQDPRKIAEAFEKWLRSFDTGGCRWKLTNHGMAAPVAVSADSPWMSAASVAIERASGKAPVLVREGATIPVVSDFKKTLGLDSLLIGFGLQDDCIHSPNEKFEIDCFTLGCRTHATLLGQFGNAV